MENGFRSKKEALQRLADLHVGEHRNKVKKSILDGMTMEVDGQYVDPQLAGIPIRLRLRNERGRWDRVGVDRVRATREAVESLKGGMSYEDEGKIIGENKKTATYPHEFKAARWTSKNGHPRCIHCGGEEPLDGMCRKSSSGVSRKFIKEEDGMFSVYSHQTGKLFGKYKTRAEAEDRLAQMHRFKGVEEVTI